MTDNELRDIEQDLTNSFEQFRTTPFETYASGTPSSSVLAAKHFMQRFMHWHNQELKQHTDKAVVEELEFAYKMATPEQKQALKDLYADRGVNKGLSFTPQANLQSKEGE